MRDDVDFLAGVQSIRDQLQMQFAHPVHHHLVRLRFATDDERRVFLFDFVQRSGNLRLIRLRFRLDRQTDHRVRERDRRHHDAVRARRQRVPCVQIVHLHEHDDFPGTGVGNLIGVRSLHVEQLADFDRLAGPRQCERRVLLHRARIDPQVTHLRDERIDAGLEHLRDHRAVRLLIDGDRLVPFPCGASHRLRRGGERCHRIHKLRDADVLLGAHAEDGDQRPCRDGLSDRLVQLVLGDRPLFEVPLHQRFVAFDRRVDHLLIGLFRIDDAAVGDVLRQVDRTAHPLEVVPQTDRHVHQRTGRPEQFAKVVQKLLKTDVVGPALVDHDHPRTAGIPRVLKRLAGVHLDPRRRTDRHDGRFDRPQRADHLSDKVRHPGGVDKIDVLAAVIEMDDRRGNRMLAFLLIVVCVEQRTSVVDRPRPRVDARFVQQQIGQRRFSDRSMSHKCHVANAVNRPGHMRSRSC